MTMGCLLDYPVNRMSLGIHADHNLQISQVPMEVTA